MSAQSWLQPNSEAFGGFDRSAPCPVDRKDLPRLPSLIWGCSCRGFHSAVLSNLDTGAIAGGCTGYSAEPLSKQRIGARHCTAAPEPIIQASTSQPQLRVIVLVCLQRGCSVVGLSLNTINCLFNLIRHLRTVDDTSEQACLWLYSRLSSSSSSSTVMTKV